MKKLQIAHFLIAMVVTSIFTGCTKTRPALPSPERVDLPRFMGTWYVVGYTPLFVDKQAHNAVEHYALDEKGRILTTYQFRKGSFDGPLKTLTPTGFVHDRKTKAKWKMQFIWPFKADYVILYLSDDYQRTIIAHPNRKYAWIMQRVPQVDEKTYNAMLSRLEQEGFDPDSIIRVPHDWSDETIRLDEMRRVGDREPLDPR